MNTISPRSIAQYDAAGLAESIIGATLTTNYDYHGEAYCFTEEAWPTVILANGAVVDYVPSDYESDVLVQITHPVSGECFEAQLRDTEHGSAFCVLEASDTDYTLNY